jgi:hypothetical protein
MVLKTFYVLVHVIPQVSRMKAYIARSNEILSWEGVGNRQLLCFFKA